MTLLKERVMKFIEKKTFAVAHRATLMLEITLFALTL